MIRKIDWNQEAELRAQSGHAIFGGSVMQRNMACTGSTRLCIENNAQGKETEYAIEGSDAHALAQRCFDTGNEAALSLDRECTYMKAGELRSFVPDEEMVHGVQEYLDWCAELPGEHFVEMRVDFVDMPLPHQFGSADHVALIGNWLIVTDFKYGQGEIVLAENNEQLLSYALGVYRRFEGLYDIQNIALRICQPRKNHLDVWETDLKALLAFGTRMREQITEAIGPEPKLVPGEKQCLFCPMSGRCAAQADAVEDFVEGDFDSFDEAQDYKPALTMEQVAVALNNREAVYDYLRALEKQVFSALADNRAVPGWKLVAGEKHRVWVDEKATEEYLKRKGVKGEKLYAKKLISPAQAEKLFRGDDKAAVSALARKPPGDPVLVPAGDPRPAYVAPVSDFSDFETEEEEDGLGEPVMVDDGLGDDGLGNSDDGL